MAKHDKTVRVFNENMKQKHVYTEFEDCNCGV